MAIEALQSLESHPGIDIVVSDINMPRMDGLSLLQKLQEADDKKSTIIVSAYGDMGNIRAAMNRGAFDFLTKPIDLADLESTIGKTLRHVEHLREVRRQQMEAERAYASLSRFFSPQLVSKLVTQGDGTEVTIHRRDVAAMFTDIADFTALVETTSSDVLGILVNEYMNGMTEVVFAHEGTVAKIIGDAIHVLFNAPGHQPDYAARGWHVRMRLMPGRRRFANGGKPRVSILVPPGSDSMWVQRLSEILVANAFSTMRLTVIRSTRHRGSRRPTNSWAHGSASVNRSLPA